MSYTKCPECNKEIPDYRADDPYCDCGWQLIVSQPAQDELNWIVVFLAVLVVIGLQILLLVFIHVVGSLAFSLPANLLAEIVPAETITLLHWFLINFADFVALALLYFGVGYYISRKSASPLMVTIPYGFTVILFKLFVIDPRSNHIYPMMVYIIDILLLLIAILSGWFVSFICKEREKEIKLRQS